MRRLAPVACGVLLALACTAATAAETAQPPACLCANRVAPLDALAFYDLIFFGEASFVGTSEDDPDRGGEEFVEFSTEGLWKGPEQRRVRVYTNDGDPHCAFRFTPGKRYLVFAKLEDAAFAYRYRTSACARTTGAASALPDLAILGEPRTRLAEPEND